jgi:hypothetical protein
MINQEKKYIYTIYYYNAAMTRVVITLFKYQCSNNVCTTYYYGNTFQY